ncbi:hypothetical protein D0Z07_2675 [Hyphodiscus hymeniophilus]|uniref:Uncharacterized protein n=1 Tax=Hyphodiscus hymeniophilus TaxID=353542 RepID=A0A9P7AZ51_9HELO|nr:hypothetical protein D0Z07_2675 [Hyphodiscus hymeniophilus]
MDFKRPLSTAQVPTRFLQSAMLTDSVPLKALRSDPRISYCLYVPTEHYNPDPSRNPTSKGEASHPSYQLPKLPLIINIHGTGRDVGSCRRRLIGLAKRERCAILAPLFPTALDDELDLDSYKLLRSKTLRADLALLDIVAEVTSRYPGIDTEKFLLSGFSGGGQFVHRFLYIHPERVLCATVGAPGRVTRLDKALNWPQGIADVGEVFGEELRATGGDVSLGELRKIRSIQMVVGGDDVQVPDEDFNEWARKMKGVLSQAGDGRQTSSLEPMRVTRVATLRSLHEEWSSLGISTTFQVVEGFGHTSEGIHPTIEAFLIPQLRDWWSSGQSQQVTVTHRSIPDS